ncbi:hypothetical protein CEXT_533721 [Caerostris extrusa]|uniref:Uncharacterized protein n=1 Tax=Caerostris extrusa TaxID=172846 RepID=A0AAV4PS87_CAEEX|nr:hypothetical protein CEXT_533721 [Caerostris extrusa]
MAISQNRADYQCLNQALIRLRLFCLSLKQVKISEIKEEHPGIRCNRISLALLRCEQQSVTVLADLWPPTLSERRLCKIFRRCLLQGSEQVVGWVL